MFWRQFPPHVPLLRDILNSSFYTFIPFFLSFYASFLLFFQQKAPHPTVSKLGGMHRQGTIRRQSLQNQIKSPYSDTPQESTHDITVWFREDPLGGQLNGPGTQTKQPDENAAGAQYGLYPSSFEQCYLHNRDRFRIKVQWAECCANYHTEKKPGLISGAKQHSPFKGK